MNAKPVVGAIGMVTPVGLNAVQTRASVRAGIERFSQTPIFNKDFMPISMAMLPEEVLEPLVPDLWGEGLTARQSRMLRMASPALREAFASLAHPERVPVLLGAPEEREDQRNPLAGDFLRQLSLQTDTPFHQELSQVVSGGRAAGLIALNQAVDLLGSGAASHVIVGGVDTFLDLYLLGRLDAEQRLLGQSVMDGFRPGEGACFLCVTTLDRAETQGLSPLAAVECVGLGEEEGHRYSEQPYRGDGLADAVRHCFGSFSEQKIETVFAGFNGESFHAKEWGVACLRNAGLFEEEAQIVHPADCVGDTGAAMGSLMAGLAAAELRDGKVSGPALIWCSSDWSHRAAAILTAISE